MHPIPIRAKPLHEENCEVVFPCKLFWNLRYSGFSGPAQFVYEAEPAVPGPRLDKVFNDHRFDSWFFAETLKIVTGQRRGPKIVLF